MLRFTVNLIKLNVVKHSVIWLSVIVPYSGKLQLFSIIYAHSGVSTLLIARLSFIFSTIHKELDFEPSSRRYSANRHSALQQHYIQFHYAECCKQAFVRTQLPSRWLLIFFTELIALNVIKPNNDQNNSLLQPNNILGKQYCTKM